MHRRTLIILFSFLLVTVVSGLDCFTGRSGYGLLYTQCNPDVYHCAKITTIDPVHGLVADKGCDTENFCSTVHSGCAYNSYDKMEICCCTSNLCNGSKTNFCRWISIMLGVISRALSLLIILIATSDALKCFVGRQYFGALGSGGSFAEVLCPSTSTACVKRHFAIQYNEDIIEKTCDQDSQCYKIGSGCYYDPNNSAEYCCCNTDSCNGATITVITSTLLITALICTTFMHVLV